MRIKKIAVLVMICIIICTINVNAIAEEDKKVILIDPGHGGIDGGAKSRNGTIEKNINLAISKKLKEVLIGEGFDVVMTREDDNAIFNQKKRDLEARCNMKVDTKCDVFISIHQNKFSQERCHGAQVWYANNDKSNQLAKYLQESLIEEVGNNNRVAKAARDKYKILRDEYDGGCVIVECGFLSNAQEEKQLQSEEHQNKIVEGIKNGINKYFDNKKEE
jgi:N-acetylmuramoyl-L-alanine amidase